MSADPDHPSLQYWKAAISTLTPEKQEAAWEFYLNHFTEGNAGDTLSALILLLEANGVFLDRLPERYHEELISPLHARLLSFQQRLAEHEERQVEIGAALDRVSRQSFEASAQALHTAIKVESSLRDAAVAVDAQLVIEGVRKQIIEGAVMPMARQLEKLGASTARIDKVTESAAMAAKTWRRVHLRGIVLSGWAIGLVIFTILYLLGWNQLEHNTQQHFAQMRDQLISDASENQESIRELAELGVTMRIVPVADSDSKSKLGPLAMVIEPAQGAEFKIREGKSWGVVYLKPAIHNHTSISIFR